MTAMDDFKRLVEQSSLGTPGAAQLRARTPDTAASRSLAIARDNRAEGPAPDSRAEAETPHTHDRVELRDLAALAGEGDRTALNDLLTRVRAVAHRYVRSRLWTYPGGADMIDDVTQEVCVAVFGALSRYRDEGMPFEAFVYGIAARKVADAQRAFAVADLSSSDVPDGADESPTPEEHAVRYAELRHVMGLMDRLPENRLPEKLREILRLRLVAGMSAEETGRALGMTPGAVRVAQHRALNTLRSFVGHEAKLERRAGEQQASGQTQSPHSVTEPMTSLFFGDRAADADLSDEELLQRHLAGDPESIDTVFKRHYHRMAEAASRILGDSTEVVLLALTEASSTAARLAGTRGDRKVADWLHEIVVNECKQQIRHRSRPYSDAADADRSPLDAAGNLLAYLAADATLEESDRLRAARALAALGDERAADLLDGMGSANSPLAL
jgi:RNA polymerase sigma-70 factor, ECF subfamily